MALTVGILGTGQIAASEGDLYNVAGTAGYVKFFRITNSDTGTRTGTIFVKKNAGTSRRILSFSLGAAGASDDSLDVILSGQRIDLAAGDAIRGICDTAAKVDFVITGGAE